MCTLEAFRDICTNTLPYGTFLNLLLYILFLWLCSFIPKKQAHKLHSFNSFFCNITSKARYYIFIFYFFPV